MTTARDIVDLLSLKPHPEGGFYRRTYRHEEGPSERGHGSAIYYLLEGKDTALWHRIDCDEIWHWYAGAPLTLQIANETKEITRHTLGTDFPAGQIPQVLVPGNFWQQASSQGDWTLCGCTVSPGFDFEGLEMADKDWHPSQG